MSKNKMNDINYINGYLRAFSDLNTFDSDVQFQMFIKEINDIKKPFDNSSEAKLEVRQDWESYVSRKLDEWLFSFIHNEKVDLKNLYLSDQDARLSTCQYIVKSIKEVIAPINVYSENSLDFGDGVWKAIIFESKEKNYILYLSQTD